MRLPGGYVAHREGRARIVAQPAALGLAVEAVRQAGTIHGWAGSHASRSLEGGRAPAYVVAAPGGPCVVRHYVRGGAVAGLFGDRYLRFRAMRPFRELWISAFARAHGIATPEVIVAAAYPSGLTYRADLVTRFIAGAATLWDIAAGGTGWADAVRPLAWRAAGRSVRDAAQAGIVHADLNLRNVLIAGSPDAPVPFLLDLDRCRVTRTPSANDVARMIRRVHQSARRFEQQTGTSAAAGLDAFEEGIRG